MKIIKVSDAVHEQLVADKKHFTESIGYSFKLSDVIKEYQKILYLHFGDKNGKKK